MKQRKSLDLNSKVSLEAIIHDDGRVELNFRVARKDYRIAGEEIEQLRNWLTIELLQDPKTKLGNVTVLKSSPNVVTQYEITPQGREIVPLGPVVSGPLRPDDPQAKEQNASTGLENRRAVTSGEQTSVVYGPKITKADDLRIHNLSGQMDKAKQAFSKESLSTFDPT